MEMFSKPAAGWIALRRALYGDQDAKALVLRCFKTHPKVAKVTEPMVLNCWQAQDDALNAALGIDGPAERRARKEAFLASRKAAR